MSRHRRDWTLRGAELYASKYPTARFALDIYRKHRLRYANDRDVEPMRVSTYMNGDVVVKYRDGRKIKYRMSQRP